MSRWWRFLLVAVFLVLTPRSTLETANECDFAPRFAELKASIDESQRTATVGACLENQRVDANGNVEQRTARGLLVFRKKDDFTFFTDGERTWAHGPQRLEARLNTESFNWEPTREYRGVALGNRENDSDLRAWIDTYGSLGHGRLSYDNWVRNGKPRDSDGKPMTDSLQLALSRLSRISPDELETKRRQIIGFIWGKEELPEFEKPSSIVTDFEDTRFNSLENLQRIDRIAIEMDFMVNSIIYLFHPIHSTGRFLIYHQGHLGGFFLGIETIQFFLRHGYTVAALSMPLRGMNSQPTIEHQGEVMTLRDHHHFRPLESESFSPLRFFIEPVFVLLDYALEEQPYSLVAMVGFSGGGWTTTLAAALDTRIERSYPVAGSLPLFFNAGRDYEQELSGFYELANYLELYVLGTYPGHRRQMQVLNEHDPCCFSGMHHVLYEEEAAAAARRIGEGEFFVFSDYTHNEHKISAAARDIMIYDLEGG